MTGSKEFNLCNTHCGASKLISIRERPGIYPAPAGRGGDILFLPPCREEAQSEVVHFADAQRALMFDKTLPVNSPSGMSDSGAGIDMGLSITHTS